MDSLSFVDRVRRHILFCIIFSHFALAQSQPESSHIRIAVFNIKELSTTKLLTVDDSGKGQDEQVLAATEIIQKINPDILVINEIDHDYDSIEEGLNVNLGRFEEAYLKYGSPGLSYPYKYTAECNTGILTGIDINNDGMISSQSDAGKREYGDDCFGYGTYPGQYAMGLYSKYPIDESRIRTFQNFLWKDLPGNHMPPDFYSEDAIKIFRLSSKSHWDVPVKVNGKTLHLFVSHPTPPAFDGEEDRNGRRNFDELKFWVAYLEENSPIYDDNNIRGGYESNDPFIIAGDLNASRHSDSRYENMTAIDQLINHPEILDSGKWLVSDGGWEGRVKGPPDYWERNTAKFGNDYRMQIDYLLPRKDIQIERGGVFWPSRKRNPAAHQLAEKASDHRLIWLDILLP
jgi:hypothetical protein